jgi:hypothetical protein
MHFYRDGTTIQLDPSSMSKALQYLPTPGYVFLKNIYQFIVNLDKQIY